MDAQAVYRVKFRSKRMGYLTIWVVAPFSSQDPKVYDKIREMVSREWADVVDFYEVAMTRPSRVYALPT